MVVCVILVISLVTIVAGWIRSLLYEEWLVVPLVGDFYTGVASGDASLGIFVAEWPPGDWFAQPPGFTSEAQEYPPDWWGGFEMDITLPYEAVLVVPWWVILTLLLSMGIAITLRRHRPWDVSPAEVL